MPDYLTDFLQFLDTFLNHEKFLDSYVQQDQVFRLEKVANLAKVFQHPESSLKLLHVAGSKGKGSTCCMLACIIDEYLRQPVGIYASPHTYDFRERITSSRGFLPDAVYQEAISKLRAKVSRVKNPEITWYELVTIFAFLCFVQARYQYAVIETGLGGRLDATNIIQPLISVITPIELEHTNILGNTLKQIATEKAGIIKPGTPVVVAAQRDASVKQVFSERAKQLNSPIYFVDELASVDHTEYCANRLVVQITSPLFRTPISARLRMLSSHQPTNAATSAIVAKILFPDIPEAIIARGLERAELPGRFEIQGNLVLDGAHTISSISGTLKAFTELFPQEKPNLLFACAADKKVAEIAPLFKNRVNQVFLTIPGAFKKSNLQLVEEAFTKQGIKFISSPDYQSIIQQAINASSSQHLLAVGSFYLLDEIRKLCYNKTGNL